MPKEDGSIHLRNNCVLTPIIPNRTITMPDFTQLIEQSFITHIKAVLEEHPEGVSEHDFLRTLDEQGFFKTLDAAASSTLLLFQKHFLLFHVLYSINQQRVADKRGGLQITPMLIKQLDYLEADTQIGEVDSLCDYYLELENLTSVTGDEVDDLLNGFWVKYLRNDKRGAALEALGLSDPVTDTKIVQHYRKLVSVHHPDKGGDKDKIQEINEAYAALIRP